jgi:hypothetical protein
MKTSYIFILLFFFVCRPALPLPQNPEPTELDTILTNTAKYCERLRTAAFHFFCQETVTETSETRTFYKKYGEPGHGLQRTGKKN